MKYGDSLPHWQQLATCPCPESDQSSSCPPYHFLKIRFDIILPSTPRTSKWSFPRKFLHQTQYAPLFHTCYMNRQSHFPLFDHPKNILWTVKIIKLLFIQLYLSCHLVPLHHILEKTPAYVSPSRRCFLKINFNIITSPTSVFSK